MQGNISLARLVDLVATQLSMTVVYEPGPLERIQLRLHTSSEIREGELLDLMNEQLIAHGFTTVHRDRDRGLSVLRLKDASTGARLEPKAHASTNAGFQRVLFEARHTQIERIAEAARPFLSAHGSISVLDEGRMVVADLSERIEALRSVLQEADAPAQAPGSRTVRLRHISGAEAVRLTGQIRSSFERVGQSPAPGELVPLADDGSLLIIAPEGELDGWEALIRSVDQVESTETRHYTPGQFGLEEVAGLLDRAFGDGDGAHWNLLVDRLTGSLLITTTPAGHERVEAMLDRLAEAPVESRRPMRSFVIRNRSVADVRRVLEELLTAGIGLEPGVGPDSGAARFPRGPHAGASTAQGVGLAGGSLDTEDLVLAVDEGTNTLLAVGSSRQLEQIEDLLGIIDVRQAQVMLEVLLVSLTEGQSKDLGVELAGLISTQGSRIALASLFGISELMPTDSAPSLGGGSGGTAVILDPGDFSAVVRALETVNDGRSLSIPRVLVNNNESGSFNSVIQEPFASTNASDTVATTSFGGTQDAGTTVSIRPQIAEGDHLVLEYSVSLSSFTGESADPALPPPRQQNNLSSVATIPDGYTIAVGGIELTTEAEAVSRTPILGSIPGLGALFRSTSTSLSRSRFYVFIRPTVLRHHDFEHLKYLSDRDSRHADIDNGWPRVQPQVIR